MFGNNITGKRNRYIPQEGGTGLAPRGRVAVRAMTR
jgi:hypothetical protein